MGQIRRTVQTDLLATQLLLLLLLNNMFEVSWDSFTNWKDDIKTADLKFPLLVRINCPMLTVLLDSLRKSVRLAEDRRLLNVTPDDYVLVHCAEQWGGSEPKEAAVFLCVSIHVCTFAVCGEAIGSVRWCFMPKMIMTW